MRRIALTAVCAAALFLATLVVAAAPSSANAPNGNGLVDFGVFNCEGIGPVSVFGPRGSKAASSFATTGQHVVLLSLDITGSDGGEPISFSKTYGKRNGLTPFTCTQHVEEGLTIADITVVVALVPPR